MLLPAASSRGGLIWGAGQRDMCQGEESGTRESSGAATVTRTSWAKAGSLAAGDRTTTTLMHDAAGW
jgi:hypothetical protein